MTEGCGNLAAGQQLCKAGKGTKLGKCPRDALLHPVPWQPPHLA